MYTIKTLNAISPVGLAKLPPNQFEIDNEAAAPQGILVRSADMHDAPLLAIARAGAGTNNIPVEDCTNKGIVVFNTPGANANAVAELVVGALVAGSRNLVDAVNWAQTLKGRDTIAKDVEKGKKAFVGPELRGKTLGVIGLGAIGARVANAAVALGMEVLGYDPYISIDAAWSLSRSVQHCVTLGDMLPRCTDICNIHVCFYIFFFCCCFDCVYCIISICCELVWCVFVSIFVCFYKVLGFLICRICCKWCKKHQPLCKRCIKVFYTKDTVHTVASEEFSFKSHAVCLCKDQGSFRIINRKEY